MTKQIDLDLQEIVNSISFLNEFDNKTIFVTGSTGLIGSTFIKSILLFNQQNNTNIKILALVRNTKRAKEKLYEDKNLESIEGTIENLPNIDSKIDYIIHGASSTSSKEFIEKPVDVLKTGLIGSFNIAEFAKKYNIKKVIFLSSLEVYGKLDTFEATEESYGLLNWTEIRSSYVEAKRASENIFLSYKTQFNINTIIVRFPQILTASFENNDNRVYAQFVKAIKKEENIVLKTKGETVRNYCYLTDAIIGLCILLDKGEAGEIYNIANENTTCSIKEMAELAIQIGGSKNKLIFDVHEDPTKLGYYPTIKIKLISKKLKKLGWNPKVGLNEAFTRMIKN